MKRIIIVVMFFFLIAGSCMLGGCEGSDFMDPKDKQPHIVLMNYMTAPTNLGGGTPSYYQEYAFRKETWTDPLTFEEKERDVPLFPISVNRFEVTIESYHINQEFSISIGFPSVGFPVYAITMIDPFKSATPAYTSNYGRGPGGYLTATVAMWTPRENIPVLLHQLYGWPIGPYTLSVLVTDADGNDAYADINFLVRKVIIEVVNLDEEE